MVYVLRRTKRLLLLFQMLVEVRAVGNDTEEILVPEELKQIQNVSLFPSEVVSTIQPYSSQGTTKSTLSTTEYVRHSIRRGFPLPRFHIPESRWGPFFEEGSEPSNITARVGATVTIDCRIGLLQDKTVTWSHHKADSIHLLTVGRSTYSSDERISLSFRYPNNFRLQIMYLTRRDQGLYECQIATHPPKVKKIFLRVIAPEVQITDELGREVTERYYRAGSDLELVCLAQQLKDSTSESEPPLLWKRDERILSKGISYNISEATNTATSTLIIAPLNKHHSGNYTCAVGSQAFSTVVVHVLNGELPAAVHSGNSAVKVFTSVVVMLASILLTQCQR